MRYIHATRDAIKSGVLIDTFLFSIGNGAIKLRLFVTALCADVIVLVLAVTNQDLAPVCPARPRFRSIRIDVFICISLGLSVRFAFSILGIVHQTEVQQFTTCIAVQCWAIIHGHVRETPVSFYAENSLAGLTLLRGNHNHTVGSTRSVERSGGSILDYSDILNIAAVQRGEDTRSSVGIIETRHVS